MDFNSIWTGFNDFWAKLLPDTWGMDQYAGILGLAAIVLVAYFFFSKDKK